MNQQGPLNTVLVTAYAKAPQGSSMYEVFKHAGIILEINKETHEIVDADFTFLTDLAKDFFKRLVVGYNLSDGVDDLVKRIEAHYYAPSSNAVIVTLNAAHKRYFERLEKEKTEKNR